MSTSTFNNSTSRKILQFLGLSDITYGEMFLFIILIVLLIGQFFYWFFDHKWENSRRVRSIAENCARSIGQVTNTITGLLVLPVTRNSVWTQVFGVSWEAALKYHIVSLLYIFHTYHIVTIFIYFYGMT